MRHRYTFIQHSEIDWAERTGYPSWKQDGDGDLCDEPDYDAIYEERRDRERLGFD